MMKSLKLLPLAVILITAMTYADSNDDAVNYFLDMRAGIYEYMPDTFEGELTGSSITEKLASIPEDYIEGDGAYVSLSFSKSGGVEIIVENVDFLYRDLFEQYVRFFTLGPVLSTQSDSTVLSKYEFEYTSMSSELSLLNLRYQNAENNFDFFVNDTDYKIAKVDYYLGEDILSSVVIQYEELSLDGDDYSIPTQFFVKTFDGSDSYLEIFKIENINLN